MAQVIIYGLVGALGLFIGSICGVFLKIKEKIIGIFMAFGAGALIAAASFGLLEESYTLSGLYHTIWAFAFRRITIYSWRSIDCQARRART